MSPNKLPEFIEVAGQKMSMYEFMLRPCESKEDLHNWIKTFLDIDLPDQTVAEGSNSSPMDLIWWIYDTCVIHEVTMPLKALFIANRSGYKTLSMAIVELALILHGLRDVIHIGAIEKQAKRCYTYLTGFIRRPLFKQSIPREPTMESTTFKNGCTAEVLPCTVAAVNGPHGPFTCLDELDVARDMQAYRDIDGIASKTRDGFGPVQVGISTMKTPYGLVAQEVENAAKSGTKIFKWNIIDLTKKCSDERSLTEEIDIYVNQDTLEAIDEATYNLRTVAERTKFEKRRGYTGCLKNCKMFAACLGRLKHQKSTSTLLHEVQYTQQYIFSRDVDWAIAQALCRKPATEGVIYNRFSQNEHVKTYEQIWEIFTGERPPGPVTFEDMHNKFAAHGVYPSLAVDPGDQLATALLCYVDGKDNVYVLKEKTFTATDDNEIAVWLREHWGTYGVELTYPDIANPSAARLLLKNGFVCSKRVDKDVNAGISTVRSFLRVPGSNRPRLFIHNSCANLIWEFPRYHRRKLPNDMFADEPEKINDHSLDALRYFLHTRFGRGDVMVSEALLPAGPTAVADAESKFLKVPTATELATHLGITDFTDNRKDPNLGKLEPEKKDPDDSGGTSGGFSWSF